MRISAPAAWLAALALLLCAAGPDGRPTLAEVEALTGQGRHAAALEAMETLDRGALSDTERAHLGRLRVELLEQTAALGEAEATLRLLIDDASLSADDLIWLERAAFRLAFYRQEPKVDSLMALDQLKQDTLVPYANALMLEPEDIAWLRWADEWLLYRRLLLLGDSVSAEALLPSLESGAVSLLQVNLLVEAPNRTPEAPPEVELESLHVTGLTWHVAGEVSPSLWTMRPWPPSADSVEVLGGLQLAGLASVNERGALELGSDLGVLIASRAGLHTGVMNLHLASGVRSPWGRLVGGLGLLSVPTWVNQDARSGQGDADLILTTFTQPYLRVGGTLAPSAALWELSMALGGSWPQPPSVREDWESRTWVGLGAIDATRRFPREVGALTLGVFARLAYVQNAESDWLLTPKVVHAPRVWGGLRVGWCGSTKEGPC